MKKLAVLSIAALTVIGHLPICVARGESFLRRSRVVSRRIGRSVLRWRTAPVADGHAAAANREAGHAGADHRCRAGFDADLHRRFATIHEASAVPRSDLCSRSGAAGGLVVQPTQASEAQRMDSGAGHDRSRCLDCLRRKILPRFLEQALRYRESADGAVIDGQRRRRRARKILSQLLSGLR